MCDACGTFAMYACILPKFIIMPRDHCLAILRYLHVADNEQQPGRDHPDYGPLYKVQHFAI